MANKVAAVFLMCVVLVAAVQMGAKGSSADDFAACFNECHDECKTLEHGDTFCEMKCDADCAAKEAAAKLGIHV